ncbi:hypothetical protein [Massilia horti]|uniref:Lipoprotein n=1 Tax=Massilia horti TaxID=2562153 RepID=A0A4Y9T5S3_9BURK|nr:hypothetical protein [Massilia horti]TFW32571.1 hypothetical protein E4O92_09415 [Massilia horti]
MRPFKLGAALLLPLLLCGCLEVEQEVPWLHGKYAGKPDNLPQHTLFHNDRLAWMAAIHNRNNFQNEYNRANP